MLKCLLVIRPESSPWSSKLASGVNHVKGTVLLTIPVTLLAAGAGSGMTAAVACGAGCLAGVILSPDLDISSRTRSEYLVDRYLGCFLGSIWFAFWWLYARLIPHRSPLSHWPIIGTISRFLYVYFFGGALWYGVTWLLPGAATWIPMFTWLQEPIFAWALLGLSFADTLHYLMDFLPFWR